jgi:maltose O-acetyltransferase
MHQSSADKSMREKMLAGECYLASDPELSAMQHRAQRLLSIFNTTRHEAAEARHADVRLPFYCDYGSHIIAGTNLFINYDCVILDCNIVRLGDRVLLGPKVQIYTATHGLDPAERKAGWEFALPVDIGNDVWLGGGAIICPGVTIGDGTTIGAGSVVTRSMPPRVLAAGNPCQVIRALDD